MYVYSLLGVCGEMGSDASQRTEPWTSHRSRLHEVLHEGGQEGSEAMKLSLGLCNQEVHNRAQLCPVTITTLVCMSCNSNIMGIIQTITYIKSLFCNRKCPKCCIAVPEMLQLFDVTGSGLNCFTSLMQAKNSQQFAFAQMFTSPILTHSCSTLPNPHSWHSSRDQIPHSSRTTSHIPYLQALIHCYVSVVLVRRTTSQCIIVVHEHQGHPASALC